ncbi:TPA: hypothetical protein ACQVH3_004750 [Serratia marcescens]
MEKDRLITERGYMMNRYIFFIKRDESKVLRKEVVTREIIKGMKRKGFRKHHVEVEADNGSDAIKKLNKNSTDYLDSLKCFSGDLFFLFYLCYCYDDSLFRHDGNELGSDTVGFEEIKRLIELDFSDFPWI